MRFGAITSVAQQARQTLHRRRAPFVKERTALGNHIRRLLAAYGIVMPQGLQQVCQSLPGMLADAEQGRTVCARAVCDARAARVRTRNDPIADSPQKMARLCPSHPVCQQRTPGEGVCPLGATALLAAVGDAPDCKSGRQMAAWLGVVPRPSSTGATPRLLGMRT